MALNAPALAGLMQPAILAAHVAAGAQPGPALNTFCTNLANGIAAAVVTHITSSAVVVGVATGAMAGGPGVPVAGTVT